MRLFDSAWKMFCTLLLAGSMTLTAATIHSVDPTLYEGTMVDEKGIPVNGEIAMTFRFFDALTVEEIVSDFHDKVMVTQGSFKVVLGEGSVEDGTGPREYFTIEEAFRDYPDLLMQVETLKQVFKPPVRISPAGHSMKTRYLQGKAAGIEMAPMPNLSGSRCKVDNDSNDSPLASKWKGWERESHSTGVQAAILSPAGNKKIGSLPVSSIVSTIAPDRQDGAMEIEVIGPGVSLPVRNLPLSVRTEFMEPEEETNPIRHGALFDENGQRFGTATKKIRDPLLEISEKNESSTRTPGLLSQWEGLPIGPYLPPDTEGDVGPNHYIQVTNVQFAIWDKSGTLLHGPVDTNSLWTGFGGPCENDNSGDAIFLYDRHADRWMLTQFAVSSGQAVCFAVSQSPDPLGTYNLYQVDTPRFPDYFKIGVWPDPSNNAYFMGTNSGYQNQYDVFAVDRERMLSGGTARATQYFQSYANLMMPADLDGASMPPAGSPGYFYTLKDGGEAYFNNPPSDRIEVYEFDVDWSTPANSSYTLTQTFTPPTFADFNWTTCGFFVNCCLPQPGTTVDLASADWWPMKRLQYRNFSGNRETLVGCWAVDVDGLGNRTGIRWFELDKSNQSAGGTWSLHDQGTHSPDSTNRWMPSISMDKAGGIALGYSVVDGTSTYPSIRYATRLATDPPGTMQAEAELWTGASSQTSTSCRWGDYSSMNVDPSDDCTFWYTQQYIVGGTWRTRIGSFVMTECLCVMPGIPTGLTASQNGDNSIYLSWSNGTPAGVTFNVYRAIGACPQVSWTQIATGLGVTNYTDNTVSGGVTYAYYVTAKDVTDNCETDPSNCFDAVTTGSCTEPPTFGGLQSVTNPQAATCTLNLSWNPGTAWCGSIVYKIYRSTTPGVPIGTPIATITNGSTTYSDIGLTFGNTYYYIVRAEDDTPAVLSDDGNTVEMSGAPSGPGGGPQTWINNEQFEGIFPPSGWTVIDNLSGGDDWDRNDALGDPNMTSGTGFCAAIGQDSLSGTAWDADLRTPSMDLTIASSAAVSFESNFQDYAGNGEGWVDVSIDGGSGWTNIWYQTEDFGPTSENLDLAAFLGETIIIRWRYAADTSTTRYFHVDNVTVSGNVNSSCDSCGNNPAVDVTPDGPHTLCMGTDLVLTAGLTGGSAPFTYQWTEDGVDIPGESGTTYTANTTGTHTYNCNVWGDGCPQPSYDVADVSVTWQSTPAFAGLTGVTNPSAATCTLNLAWDAATTPCGGPVTYTIYRSESSPVVIPGDLYVSGLSGTGYSDTGGLVNGTTYYYVVRAYEETMGVYDGNTVEMSGTPTGVGGGSATPLSEAFETWPPAGWTIVDNLGTNPWVSTATTGRANDTGGSGEAADADSDYYATGFDTELITPVIDLTTATTAQLDYECHFENYGTDDQANTDISVDGGAWISLRAETVDDGTGHHVMIDLDGYVGNTIRIRFHYITVGVYEWYWMVDDVIITRSGSTPCTSGGALPGEIRNVTWTDSNTLSWDVEATSTAGYNVYRGILGNLGNLMNANNDSCLRATRPDSSSNSVDLSADDPSTEAGNLYWYLVSGINGTGEGTIGNATAGPRTLDSTGACP